MAVKIQFRRDTAANWTAVATTVLSAGEVGYETDTGNIKVGDGTTQWGSLAYYQLPNVSVDPATTADLNNSAYRVMGRYRLNSVTSGSTFTNGPSDLDAADADSYCAMIVTSHAYSGLTTLIQQTLTQFSGSGTTLKQWVRMYDGTNYTAWTSTAHLSDSEVTTAKIADSAVTTAKIADANVTTAKILDANVTTAKIADDAVTFAKMQNSASAGLSVVGRSAASVGDFAEINAANDGEVLRRSGSAVGFGTIATAGIANSAVTAAKLASDAVTTAKILDANVTVAKIAASTIMPYPTTSGNGSGGIGQFAVINENSATASMTLNALTGLTLTGTWFFFGIRFGGAGAFNAGAGQVVALVGTGSNTGFNTNSSERVAGFGIRIA